MVYSWDSDQLNFCLDAREAMEWYSKIPKGMAVMDYTSKIYGRTQEFQLPWCLSRLPKSKDIKKEFYAYLIKNAKDKLISDISLWFWTELFKTLDVLQTPKGFVYFLLKTPKNEEDIKVDTKTEAKYILMKEFMDGYSYFDQYEMKQWKEKVAVDIAHRYEFDDIIIPNNYTLALRKAMFGANQGQNIWPDKLLMDRQYDVIRRMGRKTTIFWPRRSGKTFLLAFIARREIMAQKVSFQNQYRPITVLYLGLSDSKNQAVVQYLKGMDKAFSKNAEWMFHYSSDTKQYTFRSGKDILWTIKFISAEQKDPGIGDYADLIIIDEAILVSKSIREGLEPIINNEWAKLLTASTLYYKAPKNWNYDMMIEAEQQSSGIDPYEFIDGHFTAFKPLTRSQRTIDDKIEYQSLVNATLDDNDMVWLRYTIDDIEYMPEAKREAEKRRMWNANPQRYYAELYSRYADEGKVFNYNWCLTNLDKYKWTIYKYITTCHDSALTFDVSAVLVWGWNDELKKVVILEEHGVKKTGYYEDQAKEMKHIIANSVRYATPEGVDAQKPPIYDPRAMNTFFICDGNQKATPELFQMTWINIDYRITYSGAWEWETKSKFIHNEINVPKKILIDIAERMIENGFVLISTKLKLLLEEFDSYHKLINPQTGAIKYSKGKSDDYIHAFLMICYFFYEKLNLKYEIVTHPDKKIKKAANSNLPAKSEVIKIKLAEHLEKIAKHDQAAKSKLNQLYFHNHVY